MASLCISNIITQNFTWVNFCVSRTYLQNLENIHHVFLDILNFVFTLLFIWLYYFECWRAFVYLKLKLVTASWENLSVNHGIKVEKGLQIVHLLKEFERIKMGSNRDFYKWLPWSCDSFLCVQRIKNFIPNLYNPFHFFSFGLTPFKPTISSTRDQFCMI